VHVEAQAFRDRLQSCLHRRGDGNDGASVVEVLDDVVTDELLLDVEVVEAELDVVLVVDVVVSSGQAANGAVHSQGW
jgi:hypothetical protein